MAICKEARSQVCVFFFCGGEVAWIRGWCMLAIVSSLTRNRLKGVSKVQATFSRCDVNVFRKCYVEGMFRLVLGVPENYLMKCPQRTITYSTKRETHQRGKGNHRLKSA